MLTGKTFRSRSYMLGISTDGAGERAMVPIPPGETFRVLSGPPLDNRPMVKVAWAEKTLIVFAEDIKQRCDEVTPEKT